MVKNVKIRILAFFMALTLSFCVVSSDYQEVNALEWASTVVAFDTALKAILGLLGVGVAVGTATQIDWGQLKDDCVEYQIAQGTNSALVGKWWNDVINGALDTGSECWASFKAWVKNELLSSGSSGGGSADVLTAVQTVFPNVSVINTNYDINFTYALYNVDSNGAISMYFFPANYTFIESSDSYGQGYIVNRNGGSSGYYTDSNKVHGNIIDITGTVSDLSFRSLSLQYYVYGFTPNASFTHWHEWDITSGSGSAEGAFDSAFTDIGAIDLAPDIATDLPYDGVIDIPWENVGATDTAIDDAFDDALDKVNTGTWTLDQYWTWVQNVTNVFAYDTTNNFLLPNDGDDEKADDKIQQNINRGAMVLYGLEKVFPFCIPWDIYAFVNLLVADPVAPVIEYPIYNPVSGEDEVITIDFSIWESTVVLFRYIQDFLLIIGLLLLARSLIGAGGSD